MKVYLAPLEGITGWICRNAIKECFDGFDKYFVPFIKPNQKGHFSSREKKDVMPEHNRGMYTIPQILTNNVEDFLRTAEKLREYGYEEVNLNLGCPSRTVVTKGRGAGFLAEPDRLDAFLDAVFSECRLRISVKTRLGMEDAGEFSKLLEIYNRYPMEELIIHPRVQKDFYKNTPNLEAFADALANSRNPVCYNGDIRTGEDMRALEERFPALDRVMIGRGLLVDPALHLQLQGGRMPDKAALRTFHDRIYDWYRQEMPGARPVLFKMKELWAYLNGLFPESQKQAKKIRKSGSLAEYQAAVEEVFALHSPRAAL